MNLPSYLSELILQNLGIPDLDTTTRAAHTKKLQIIRRQMKNLASDFAASIPAEDRYSDAYFAYNFPMNVAKTMVVMQEMRQQYPGLLANKRSVRVLDVGCGEGAGSLGVYYGLRRMTGIDRFEMTGIDGSQRMLSRAEHLHKSLRKKDPDFRMRLLKRKIGLGYRFAARPTYDLVLCVNSLAEILRGSRIPTRFITSLMHSLVDDGLLIIIEPALKEFSRRLMTLRDELSLNNRSQVVAPCLHDSPCALLELDSRNEWCHQSVVWSPPRFLELFNQGLNREIDVLKFSYLVLAKNARRIDRPKGYRVVSQLLKEKGKMRCFICTPEGRVQVVRLDRSMSAANAAFEKIYKHAIINLEDFSSEKEYWQVTEQTKVHILK